MRFFRANKTYDFMRLARVFVPLSLLLCIASAVLLIVPGPVLGTDFRGGTEVELAFKQPVLAADLRTAAEAAGLQGADVILVEGGQANQFIIRVSEVAAITPEQQAALEKALCFGAGLDEASCPKAERPEELKLSPGGERLTLRYATEPNLDAIRKAVETSGIALREGREAVSVVNAREHKVEVLLKSVGDHLMTGFRESLGESVVPERPLRVEWIGPKAGAQLRNAAVKSVGISLLFIMLYVAFRFDFRYAPGGILALIHDALMTLGVLVVVRAEVNLGTVAAILTIIGFSINDTVVVYDRVRENMGRMRGASFVSIINTSLSEMLGRTLLTSATVVMSLLVFFFVGTGALKAFAGTLVVGMVFGVYSSIYIALPATDWLDRHVFAKLVSPKKPGRPGAPKTDPAV